MISFLMWCLRKAILITALIFFCCGTVSAEDGSYLGESSVNEFIDYMVSRHGFKRPYMEDFFSRAKVVDRSVKLMDKPAESLDWGTYLARVITDLRTADGVKYYKKHKKILLAAQKKYGVPSYIIAGVIGVETNYGQTVLKYRAADTLATLGFFYPRRERFFKSELESLLIYARKTNTDPFSYLSSYAGAVGIPQFMPGNILKHAVDGNGDGRVDIVKSQADAIHSVANYLKAHGWKKGQPVSVKVRVKGDGYKRFLQESPCSSKKASVNTFKKAGVSFPVKISGNLKAVLFPVEDGDGTEYHVSFENFCVLAKYNPSSRYVMGVNYLGNRIGRRVGARLSHR